MENMLSDFGKNPGSQGLYLLGNIRFLEATVKGR